MEPQYMEPQFLYVSPKSKSVFVIRAWGNDKIELEITHLEFISANWVIHLRTVGNVYIIYPQVQRTIFQLHGGVFHPQRLTA